MLMVHVLVLSMVSNRIPFIGFDLKMYVYFVVMSLLTEANYFAIMI